MKPNKPTRPEDFIGKNISVLIDRPLSSQHPQWNFIFPVNYGYVEGVISGDGEELDAYVLGVFEPVDVFKELGTSVIHRLDDNDPKLVLVPDGAFYSNDQILALVEFQEWFFDPFNPKGSDQWI